jgi:magnesium-transporting ATPase (P-type)
MTRPPRPISRPLLTRGLLTRIAGAGGFSAAAALGLLVVAPSGTGQWLAYTALVCGQAVRAYANRSLREPIHRLSRNTFLLAACCFAVVVQAAIPFVPPLADAFRAVPLTASDWLLVAAIALAPAVLAQLVRARRRTVWVA